VAKKRKEVVVEKNGLKLVFWKESRDEVNVDVYRGEEKIMEWAFPLLPGFKSLQAAADLWTDQAIIQARDV